MKGFSEFIQVAAQSRSIGAVIISFVLTIIFFVAMLILSMFSGGFVITLAVIMTIAGIVSLIFFFIGIAQLFEDAS